MDEQFEPAVDLASVAQRVAETDRRRTLVEDELAQAQSIVEALKARSQSLRESVLDLERQLDATTKAKAEEDVALAKTTENHKRAIAELSALTSEIDRLRTDSELKSAAIGANLDDARAQLAALESSVAKAKADAGNVEETVAKVRHNLAEARRRTDALESELAAVEETTRSVVGIAEEAQVRVREGRAALDTAAERKRETETACAALNAIGTSLRAKTAEATKAMNDVDRLVAEQDRQTAMLSARLAAVSKLAGRAEAGNRPGAGRADTANGPAGTRVPTPRTVPEPVDARFADSIRAIALLTAERMMPVAEAERLSDALRAGAGDRVLREAWAQTVDGPLPLSHRLIFAAVLQAVGDVKAAVVYYEQAVSAKSSPAVIRYLAALAYLKLDLIDRAALVAQLLGRDKYGRLLGRIIDALRLEQTGRPDEAVHMLTHVLDARGNPKWEHDEALFQLGCLHERSGDMHAARSCYEKLTGDWPPNREVLERLRGLEHTQGK